MKRRQKSLTCKPLRCREKQLPRSHLSGNRFVHTQIQRVIDKDCKKKNKLTEKNIKKSIFRFI